MSGPIVRGSTVKPEPIDLMSLLEKAVEDYKSSNVLSARPKVIIVNPNDYYDFFRTAGLKMLYPAPGDPIKMGNYDVLRSHDLPHGVVKAY